MATLFSSMGDPAFIPHGYCLSWNPWLVGMHVASDSVIAVSYFSIPIALLYFALKRRETAFNGILLLFAGFIVACGMTHVMAVYTLWQPAYWADGLVKAGTAGISLISAVALWPLIPRALALPTPMMLQREIAERQSTETQLRAANRQLEATRQRLEEEIDVRRRAEERLAQVFELAPHAMVITNPDGSIAMVNSQLLSWFGYARGELVGKPVETLIPERVRQHHPALREGYMSAPSTRPVGTGRALFALRRDGTEFPVDISLSALGTPEGMHVLAAIVDMTERHEAEARLRHTNETLQVVNQELEAFSYSVSHDLRQPVRSMSGFANILLEDYGSRLDGKAKDYLKRIQQAGLRMGQMIEALLGLSRISRAALHRERVDVSAMAQEVFEEIRLTPPGPEPRLEIVPGLEANADPRLVRILLQNLLANAWKFGAVAQNPNITLGQDTSNGEHRFFVRDNGAGFDMAYANKLFGVFQRLHATEDFPGTGIGLATAQRIVTRHGGRIWAHGEVGAGAVFYFTL